jgi:hypothetical protein
MSYEELLSKVIAKVGSDRAMDHFGSYWNQNNNGLAAAIEILREELDYLLKNQCKCQHKKEKE